MKRIALALLPLTLAGCSELLPTIAFDRFDVQDLSFEKIDTDFVFRVDNPNPVSIDLSTYGYALQFESVQLLAGENDDGFTLEADGGSELSLPVGVVFADAWNLVQATRGEDEIGFGLDGHFGFDTPIGEADLPFSESGEFPALRTPKFSFQQIRVGKLDVLTGEADLEIDLGVDNEHGSMLWFDQFNFDLGLAGTNVVAGTIPTLGAVEGATTETVTLPISANLLNAGVAVITSLINKEPLQMQLAASMDVDTPFGVVPLQIDESGQISVQ
jgi:LEA14-like dessication related protein